MLACKMGLILIVELLLNNQANLRETNILGDTSLKLAQKFGHEELVLLLIQKYKALIRQPSRK
jgi:ankyrin repeat protein